MNPFGSQELLDSHTEYCGKNEAVKIVMPKEGSYISFKIHFKKVRHLFVIYADFESLMEPIATGQPDPKKKYTNKYQHHKPVNLCYYIKCFNDKVYKPKLVCYTAKSEEEDVSQIFVDVLSEEIKDIYHRFKEPVEMAYGEKERENFEKSKWCLLCEREFSPAHLEKDGLWG